jgi:AcrR family transcriptional regulator
MASGAAYERLGDGTGHALPHDPKPVRERVLDAATAITCNTGWGDVTMAKVAGLAKVSRQTVYNEYGGKPALGQAMVLRELDRFLAVVAHELDTRDELADAIRAAAEGALRLAHDNPLLHAILASAHSVGAGSGPGSDNDLLPFLTTDAAPLIGAAKAVVVERLHRFPDLALSPQELDGSVDAIIRLVLSHVMQPGGDPASTADDLAWIARRVLRG